MQSKMIGSPTFDDLRYQFGSGRSYLISGEGRNRKYGYRRGVVCKLGDIERHEWEQMMLDLIHRSGEDELFQHLSLWYKESCALHKSENEIKRSALIWHSLRLFDDPAWVDYLKFNQRFRPQTLENVPIAYVRTECCEKLFMTTQALLKKAHDGKTYCQICGRWSPFVILDTDTYTALTLPDEQEEA